MQNDAVVLEELLNHPSTMKILIALLDMDQAYVFQLTRVTGHHSVTLGGAIDILLRGKMIKVVPGKTRIKNTGDFYALTPHGIVVAKGLQDIARTLESMK